MDDINRHHGRHGGRGIGAGRDETQTDNHADVRGPVVLDGGRDIVIAALSAVRRAACAHDLGRRRRSHAKTAQLKILQYRTTKRQRRGGTARDSFLQANFP